MERQLISGSVYITDSDPKTIGNQSQRFMAEVFNRKLEQEINQQREIMKILIGIYHFEEFHRISQISRGKYTCNKVSIRYWVC